MEDLFRSGHIVDLIVAVMGIEATFVWLTGRARSMHADLVTMLLPGLFLLLALRCALTQTHWMWIALCLALAFPAHLLDLKRRIMLPSRL